MSFGFGIAINNTILKIINEESLPMFPFTKLENPIMDSSMYKSLIMYNFENLNHFNPQHTDTFDPKCAPRESNPVHKSIAELLHK